MIMMGLKLSSPLEAAVWTPTTPVFTLILEYLFPTLFFYGHARGDQRIKRSEDIYVCRQERDNAERDQARDKKRSKDKKKKDISSFESLPSMDETDSVTTFNQEGSANHIIFDQSIPMTEDGYDYDDDDFDTRITYHKTKRTKSKTKQQERRKILTAARAGGILLTLIGCLTVILVDCYNNKGINDSASTADNSSILLAHFCFFCGIFSTAGYVLFMKPLLRSLPPYTVTAGYYTIGALFLIPFLIIFQFISMFSTTLCPPSTCRSYYDIPTNAILPLVYLVLVTSILGYLLLSYANTYLSGSLISSYSGLIPIWIFILKGIIYLINGKDAEGFNWGKSGIVLVLIGLYIVAKDDKRNAYDL